MYRVSGSLSNAVMIVTIGAVSTGCAHGRSGAATDAIAPRQAMVAFIDALNARDLARMTSAFADDVTAFVPTAQADRIDGKAALSTVFADFVAASPNPGGTPVVPEDLVVDAGRDVAVASFNVRDPGSRRVNRRSFVFRRAGSRWLITHFHASMIEETMSARAEGSFEVKVVPLAAPAQAGGVGRMSIDKVFHGDLVGTSRGEMLAVHGMVDGSAGYVAMERFTGTVRGRTGSFALQHSGVMERGAPSLSVTIVPDSGTEGLAGIAGSLEIIVEGGSHAYVLRYTLPDP